MILTKKYSLLFFIASILLAFPLKTFSQELEGLKSELPNLKGEKQVDQYLKIGILYSEKYGQPDSVLSYSNKSERLSREINNTDGVLKSQLYTAIGFQQKNTFDTAIFIFKKVLSEKGNANNNLLGDFYYQLGLTYYRSGDPKQAIENLINAIPFYKRMEDDDRLLLTYCKLADALESDMQHVEATVYKNKSLELLPKVKSPYAKITANNILSSIYFDLRESSPAYIDTSLIFAEKAFSLMKEYGYYMRANQILNSISDAYYVKKDYRKSLEYCKQALTYRKYLYPGEIIISYMKYSDCSSMLGQNKDALIYLDSIKIALGFIDSQYYRLGYYQRYYDYNKTAGKYVEALEGLEHYNAINDSMFNVDKSSAINELVQKYDRAENEKKILELNKKNEIASLNVKFLIVGIIATIFAILIIIFFYRQIIYKNKFTLLNTEQRLNRARMNPHFFFNALTSIQTLSEDEETKKDVPLLISKFSKIMRQSLESTYYELVTIETEIDFIGNYIELQKTRYPNRFNYKITTSPEIDVSEIKLPSMLLQPFIENSIEHGFKNLTYRGVLQIHFSIENNLLKITSSDNGHGLKDDDTQKAYPSRATQIIDERLMLLNKQYKSNAYFNIIASKDTGVEVVVHLPIIK